MEFIYIYSDITTWYSQHWNSYVLNYIYKRHIQIDMLYIIAVMVYEW